MLGAHRALSRKRPAAGLAAAVVAAVLLAGCTGDTGDTDGPSGPDRTATGSAAPTPAPTARAVPAPKVGSCHRLTYAQAVAPTAPEGSVPCAQPHTSITYAAGALDDVVRGHLVAVDSARVQEQVARTCPRELQGFLGGTPDDLRLSMLRPIWFTPTVEQSDEGARWYRCDVIEVTAGKRLVPLGRDLRGALGRTDDRERYAMCGTAAPDAASFRRVPCAEPHTWRAISVVDLPDGAYPGTDAVRDAGQAPCEDAGRDVAADPLSFTWGYEWPTREQWAAGQTYGRCWAPD
ncbi:septum formation family protein [Nocardioides ochotonae]|uniref:septum formation family protein n=1 Tax=Nocardioides ochotonae TaxID=2685869 RepID=UPI0031330315